MWSAIDGRGQISGRRSRPACNRSVADGGAPLIAVPGGVVRARLQDEPGRRRRAIHREVGPAVAVIVAWYGDVAAGSAPLIHGPGGVVRARLQDVPGGRGRAIHREVALDVAVIVAWDGDIGADAPLKDVRR